MAGKQSEGLFEVSLDEQLYEVDRELALRERVYPRWVAATPAKLSQASADRYMLRLRAVRATLLRLIEQGAGHGD